MQATCGTSSKFTNNILTEALSPIVQTVHSCKSVLKYEKTFSNCLTYVTALKSVASSVVVLESLFALVIGEIDKKASEIRPETPESRSTDKNFLNLNSVDTNKKRARIRQSVVHESDTSSALF